MSSSPTAHNKAGLCRVIGMGNEFQSDSFGNAVRDRFASLEDTLTKKYGGPTSTTKKLQSGSIWNEPRDWMMGLLKKERTYVIEWEALAAHPLPDHLSEIRMTAVAVRPDQAELLIKYEFDNAEACDEEIAATRDASL